jgi:superfamily II DNA or RNA helicase
MATREAEAVMIALRDYQSDMLAELRQTWEDARCVLGVLPTGGGKTEVAISAALDEVEERGRVLVVTERKSLVGQWVQRFARHGFTDVGVIQAENTRRTWAPCVVGTIHSLAKRGVPEDVSLIVVDEAHLQYKDHLRVLEDNPQARVLGLTATPLREGLGLTYQDMVVGATIGQLIEAGYLVPARTLAPRADELAGKLEQIGLAKGDYAPGELSSLMRSRAIVGDVVGTWQRMGEDRQTIAFCVDKEHARELAREFEGAGVSAAYVLDDTDDEERADLFARFDSRDVRVLCSVGVLSIGFDAPIASCAVLARPTLSLSLHIQQGGRVLRPFPGKTDALILDHACNTLRHGLLEDFVPPRSLSLIDAHADRKKRREAAQAWICSQCDAVNALGTDVCVECGTPRHPRTAVVVLDGVLREVPEIPGEPLPGPTPAQVHDFYLMAAWHAEHIDGIAKKKEWAWHAARRRFGLEHASSELLRRVLPWRLRDERPIPPDAEATRWFRDERRRYVKAKEATVKPDLWRANQQVRRGGSTADPLDNVPF